VPHRHHRKNKGKYIVLVEGAVPLEADGVYCMIGGKTAESILQTVARMQPRWWRGAVALPWLRAGRQTQSTGATPIYKLVDKPVINVPGCPPIADVMMGVVTHLLCWGKFLRSTARPAERILRPPRPRHLLPSAQLRCRSLVESFDDENARKGYCFTKWLPRARSPTTPAQLQSGTKARESTGHPLRLDRDMFTSPLR